MKRFTLIIAVLLAANYIFMRGHKMAHPTAETEAESSEDQSADNRAGTGMGTAPKDAASDAANTETEAQPESTPFSEEGYRPAKEITGDARVERLRAMAKNAIGNGYTSLKSFHAEYDRYSSDLRAGGWAPRTAVINYKMGFLAPHNPRDYIEYENFKENPQAMDTDSFIGKSTGNGSETYSYSKEAANIHLSDYASYCKLGCTPDDRKFELLLVLPLDEKHFDVWVISDRKEIELVKDGTQL